MLTHAHIERAFGIASRDSRGLSMSTPFSYLKSDKGMLVRVQLAEKVSQIYKRYLRK